MKNKSTLPILLTNPRFLIIGGGNVALHKAKVLSKNNIAFKLISPKIKKNIYKYTSNTKQKKFKLKHIKDSTYIINASGNNKITKKLIKYKKKNNVLLNISNKPELCDFYFMALTSNKNLQIAVSSNGYSPKITMSYRDKCQKLIPKNINKQLKKLSKIRKSNI